MNAGGIFVTGTDTSVGKTWVTTRLISALREKGVDAVGMKPIECGGREDSSAILGASGSGLTLEQVNPVHLPDPVAPAAISPTPTIDLEDLAGRFDSLAAKHEFIVVEGAGGWLVPLDETRTVADLAICLGLPVLIVAANRLGVLNHTLLTAAAIQDSSLPCQGVFLNSIGPEELSRRTNLRLLENRLAPIPVVEDSIDLLLERCRIS